MAQRSVKEYWDSKAKRMGVALDATMRDINLRKLEIDLILERVGPSDDVLDVGCGNGASTVVFAGKVARIVGIDYSGEMIEQAQRLAAATPDSAGNVSFRQMNVLDLSAFPEGSFDAVISERCLINLADWGEQQRAILQMRRALRSGGRLLMIEGTTEGLARLNAMRVDFGLTAIEKHWHNVLFSEETLRAFLAEHFDVAEIRGMGTYYFLGRVVHPLLVAPEEPSFEAAINAVAREVARHVDCLNEISINALYTLVKR